MRWYFCLCLLLGVFTLGCGSSEDDLDLNGRFNAPLEANAIVNFNDTSTPTANGDRFFLTVVSNGTNANVTPLRSDRQATVTAQRTPNAANFDRLDLTLVVADPTTGETRTLFVVLDKGAQGPVVAGDVFVVGSTLQVPGAAGTYMEVATSGSEKVPQNATRRFVSLSGNVRVQELSPTRAVIRLNPMVFTPTNTPNNSAFGDFTLTGDITVFFN